MIKHKVIKLSGFCKDLTGQRFGRLVALEPVGRDKYNGILWKCQCDCGNTRIVHCHNLTSGNTKSCGCLHKEQAVALHLTHGMSHSSEYSTWKFMLQRCENPNHKHFKYYGGRDIRVCKRWHKFENFYEDMGQRPEGKSIDRIDNNGNYEPGNCKWSTPHEQMMNRRPNSKGPNQQKCFFACDWSTMRVYSSNNQSQFARDHNLNNSKISVCLHNQQSSYKGWTFSYCPF